MRIEKIAHLSDEEIELLMSAGKLIKSIKEQLATKEIDTVATNSKELLSALANVIAEVIK